MSRLLRIFFWTFAPFVVAAATHFLVRDLLDRKLPHDEGVLSAGLAIVKLVRTTNETDSWLPMLQAREVANGPQGSRLYETVFFERRVKFQYPPTSLLALDALQEIGLLSISALNTINRVFFFLNAVAIAACASVCVRRRWVDGRRARTDAKFELPALSLGAFTAALVFWPLVKAIDLGQVQVWLDLIFTLACLAWLLDRRLLAGALIGIACTIKPQFGLLLVWAVFWRQWDFTKGFLIAAIPLLAASLQRYGWHNHWAYLDVLSYLSRHGETLFPNNSVNGIVNRLLFNGSNLVDSDHTFSPYHPVVYAATLAAFVGFTLIALIPALRRRRKAPTIFDFGIAALCSVMGSPIAWEHHYGIMMPLFVVSLGALLALEPPDPRRTNFVLLGVSWALSSNYLAFTNLLSDTRLNILQSYLFFGGILLLAVLFNAARDDGMAESRA
jgi:hypothetical protein